MCSDIYLPTFSTEIKVLKSSDFLNVLIFLSRLHIMKVAVCKRCKIYFKRPEYPQKEYGKAHPTCPECNSDEFTFLKTVTKKELKGFMK